MEFKFFNYKFSNDLTMLYDYLKENNIKYKVFKNYIKFNLINEYCKKPIEIKVLFSNELITRMYFTCIPISFNNRKKIEEEIITNYKLTESNMDTSTSYYEAEDYVIKVVNPEMILIDVQFEKVIENVHIEQKKNNKLIILFTIIGVVFSVLFIFLYFKFKFQPLNIITAVIACGYALYQFYYIYLKEKLISNIGKIAVLFFVPILYIGLISVFSLLLGIRMEIVPDSNFKISLLDVIFVFMYLFPSFHLVLGIGGLALGA